MGIGAACHTLNPRLSLAHLAAMVVQAEDRMLAIGAGLADLAAKLLENCPTIQHVILLDEARPDVDAFTPSVTVWTTDGLLSAHGRPAPWGEFDELTEAGLCFTSGTTGAPKGVIYTHRSNYLHTLRLLQADALGMTADDVMLAAVPMFHANGWALPFAAPAVGAKLVLPGRQADGASLAALVRGEGVTMAAGVPTVWLGVVDHLEATGRDLPSLTKVFLGGAPVTEALMDRLVTGLDASVHTSWGMTELSPLGTIWPTTRTQRPVGASGRVLMGLDLKLTDGEGVTLPQQRGVEGHLKVKGASVVERYLGHDESATDAEGYFDTGDLATIDTAGNLTITGRAKDLIKSGGEWINPAEIERLVGGSPAVVLAAVIGREHVKWGERPILVVQMRAGDATPDQALLDRLQGQVASWWMPDAVVRVVAMPLAATGKIDKARLRTDYGRPS